MVQWRSDLVKSVVSSVDVNIATAEVVVHMAGSCGSVETAQPMLF